MKEGDGNWDGILFRELNGFTDKVTIIEDIVMGQHRTLRIARCAWGELNIDRIIEL